MPKQIIPFRIPKMGSKKVIKLAKTAFASTVSKDIQKALKPLTSLFSKRNVRSRGGASGPFKDANMA